MANSKLKRSLICGLASLALLSAVAAVWAVAGFGIVRAQQAEYERFRDGEKLTYNISFGKFRNAAYAEVYVASKGTLEGKSAFELQGRVKSVDVVSAAFYFFDRSRTVFASDETGFPLYIRDVSNVAGLPKEEISNFLSEPSTNLDLLTMFYQARENGGAGSFSVLENGKIYSFSFAPTGGETVKAASGDYETSVSSVTSAYFDENGVTDVRVNFSNDKDRIPVQISLRTAKGSFRAVLASSSIIAATPTPEVSKTPVPIPTPTAKSTPSPTPYIENQGLSAELPFKLGESLSYSVSSGGRQISELAFSVESRKMLEGKDSLVIKAKVNNPGDASLFTGGDTAEVWVDPYTLVPNRFTAQFNGALSVWSRQTVFDQIAGTVTTGGANRIEVPIGTHSLLSFAYAIRSFNLRPSKDLKNPVNDTRVAVFINQKAYILTLRPSPNEKMDQGERQLSAQLITIITGDSAVDRLRPRVWLSADSTRVPLRVAIGDYQADLIR